MISLKAQVISTRRQYLKQIEFLCKCFEGTSNILLTVELTSAGRGGGRGRGGGGGYQQGGYGGGGGYDQGGYGQVCPSS